MFDMPNPYRYIYIDILQNSLINIDINILNVQINIDIFKNGLIDINILKSVRVMILNLEVSGVISPSPTCRTISYQGN